MANELLTVDGDLRAGKIRERQNRFILTVEFDSGVREQVYISNTGSWNVTKPGRKIIVRPVDATDRKTAFDAVFVEADGVWVSVNATFANTAFQAAVDQRLVPPFEEYSIVKTEPSLPSGGRSDFELETPEAGQALVEVKSCTLVEGNVATFPDRPTERGRRHLRELIELQEGGTETHLVFVIQRPDGEWFRPNASVDPELATLVSEAIETGVGIHAIQLSIDPPDVSLGSADVPIEV